MMYKGVLRYIGCKLQVMEVLASFLYSYFNYSSQWTFFSAVFMKVVGFMVPPTKTRACPNSWDLWMWPYLGKGLPDLIKDFKISSPWNIQLVLNPVTSVLIRDRWGDRHRGAATRRWNQRREGGAASPGNSWGPRSWKRQEGPSPGALGGSAAQRHLDLRHLSSKIETTGVWCFKMPRLLTFILAGN